MIRTLNTPVNHCNWYISKEFHYTNHHAIWAIKYNHIEYLEKLINDCDNKTRKNAFEFAVEHAITRCIEPLKYMIRQFNPYERDFWSLRRALHGGQLDIFMLLFKPPKDVVDKFNLFVPQNILDELLLTAKKYCARCIPDLIAAGAREGLDELSWKLLNNEIIHPHDVRFNKINLIVLARAYSRGLRRRTRDLLRQRNMIPELVYWSEGRWFEKLKYGVDKLSDCIAKGLNIQTMSQTFIGLVLGGCRYDVMLELMKFGVDIGNY